MKRLSLLTAFIFTMNNAFCQAKYWQQQVNYNISVTLNDTDNSLTADEQIDYYNNSPDTLHFIWFHLWSNAYKNDRTAFSDQLLENGRTDFYFSEENKKGYINRLNFKVDDKNAVTEDHPQHQDIVKLLLPQPLLPGGKIKIETPFHVKLPFNFSRGGHVGQSYQITQWYPKPAVYDRKGWHEIPYLDQGEFYSEYGNFDVKITLPENYVTAATGELQDAKEKDWLLTKIGNTPMAKAGKKSPGPKKDTAVFIPSSAQTKTLHYIQSNVHDFAWFADKRFSVKHDTIRLASGRVIDAYAFILPGNENIWKNSIPGIKRAVLSKSNWIGEYPYNVVSVVDNASSVGGGMEYPTITLLSSDGSESGLESVINHEVGHNWFYGILGTNERIYPWMDEGMNTFYDKRYDAETAVNKDKGEYADNKLTANRVPENPEDNLLAAAEKIKKDQPINTPAEKFTPLNYNLIAYEKTGLWLQQLEKEIGRETFDKIMQAYYERWKFKHPYPEDFHAVAEEISGRDLSAFFKKADVKGSIYPRKKKQLKFATLFNFKDADKYSYISAAPAIGYNMYDKFMIGAIIHNYNVPPDNFQFIAVPLYAAGSKKFNGIGRAEYNFFPGSKGARATVAGSIAKFTGDEFTDPACKKNPMDYLKIVPSLKYVFANKEPRSRMKKYIQWKTYLITETVLAYSTEPVSGNVVFNYPKEDRYLNQLQAGIENNRVLYPYEGVITAQQGKGFVRLDLTGNYYFNYAKDGGLNLRFFAGKFIYTGDKGFTSQYLTDRYHLNLTGPKGYEDYTYSDYFIGRNEFEGGASQQIMKRDGFFKVKTDLLSDKIGKTDDWLCAVNLTTDIPKMINPLSVLPIKIPLRIFLDAGTYAEAWKNNTTNTGQPGKLLYDAGFQVSLLHDVLNVYFPVIYSKVYRDYFKSTVTEKRFVKNISFSFDLQQLKVSKLAPQLSF